MSFVFISDQPPPRGLGSNIRWILSSLKELRSRLSDAVGFPIALEGAYKLCDYKPVLGSAFAEELDRYDFWGFTDPDLVWGHIRSFATEERLARYDVLTFRGRGYISGPCTLLRNTPDINELYRAGSYEEVFRQPPMRAFTELLGRWHERMTDTERAARGETISFSDVVRGAQQRGILRWLDVDEIVERDPSRSRFLFEWRQGHLYQIAEDGRLLNGEMGREVLMYHYVSAKKRPFFFIPEQRELPEFFSITQHGVFMPSPSDPIEWGSYQAKRFTSGSIRWTRQLQRRVIHKVKRPFS